MKKFTQALTVMGIIQDVDPEKKTFSVKCGSGDVFITHVSSNTWFQFLRNIDNLDQDRVPNPINFDNTPYKLIEKYLSAGQLIAVHGIYQIDEDRIRFDGRIIYICGRGKDQFMFEETHWWLTQTERLADQWLDSLFGDKRNYELDDFVSLYHTDLNIIGLQTDDNVQECAVLARLIYGFSAAYLLTGDERYYKAAEAGVKFQRDAFRSLSHDGQHCFWASARRKQRYGTDLIIPSKNKDDEDSIPLYEQIYALAGMTLYYRISQDWEVLEDIRRTINMFNAFYLDEYRANDPAFQGHGGYFSHIDYVTMRPDKNFNAFNNLKKNWNSVGDHIPAYLINLILALELSPNGNPELEELQGTCHKMLKDLTSLILDKFPDPNPNIPYVNERFYNDWKPDHTYQWQQNRAIIGHNFKIAWNLTRVANWYDSVAGKADQQGNGEAAKENRAFAARCTQLANKLGKAMTEKGVDQIRGGCFDAVEREPTAGQPLEFTWMNTKDFWQQEQAILAYLILYGKVGMQNPQYLAHARAMEAFWNFFFLDRDNKGMFFRVTDNGLPIVDSSYGVRGGHSDASGYHCFELNYLSHIYNRLYVAPQIGKKADASFCLYFKPSPGRENTSINVLPDFIPFNGVKIKKITINGVPRKQFDPFNFQVQLGSSERGGSLVVEFEATNIIENHEPQQGGGMANQKPLAGKKIGVLVESLYIPDEIRAYQQDFKELGAEVQLISRLWGNSSLKFVSDPNGFDEKGNPNSAETLEVSLDLDQVKLEDYSAIIMSANYTSVRLRYFQSPEQPQDAKAVQFFANAMANPKIIKGALCHGLWILTPRPELLKGRRVICHEVLRADVTNAGALFTPSENGVVLDRDLITGHSKDVVHEFIQAIAKQIQNMHHLTPTRG